LKTGPRRFAFNCVSHGPLQNRHRNNGTVRGRCRITLNLYNLQKTIYDIAKAAGVSIATVSRVFNKAESVKPATRKKVLKVADKMGYQPHVYAQGLASKKKNRVVMLVPVMSNYFLTEILRGVQDCLSNHEIELTIVNINPDDEPFRQAENIIKKSWAEGYVLVSLHLGDDQLEALRRYKTPISLVDDQSIHFDSVSFNNEEGAFKATNYLVKKGFKRIVFLSGKSDSIPVEERLKGYRKALQDNNISFDQRLIVTGDSMERDGFTEKSGYEAMKKILKMRPIPDAIFSTSDIKAIGAQKAMREAGTIIPMISFDNLSISEYIGLSTVSQPMYTMGFNATKKLLERIKNRNTEPTHEIHQPELIIRNSSEPVISKKEAI
jgi:LacI family transcriptional regulator